MNIFNNTLIYFLTHDVVNAKVKEINQFIGVSIW